MAYSSRNRTDKSEFSRINIKYIQRIKTYKEVQSRKSALGDILNQARKNAEKLE